MTNLKNLIKFDKDHSRYIYTLFKKDILLEIRQQYSFYGVLLYVASTIFVLYLAIGQPEETVWKALFWMMQLFICINAVAKSFLQESRGRLLYFYSIAGATHFILAKLIFNAVLMLVMNLLGFLLFQLLLGSPLQNPFLFIAISCFGGVSLSLVFTFLAAIAARATKRGINGDHGFPIDYSTIIIVDPLIKHCLFERVTKRTYIYYFVAGSF